MFEYFKGLDDKTALGIKIVLFVVAVIILLLLVPALAENDVPRRLALASVENPYESIQLALIVAIPAMLSPLLLAWLTNRSRRLEKQEDYARQDLVAEKAAAVAKKAEEAARLLAISTKTAEAASNILIGKVDKVATVTDQVHILVNSKLTATTQKLRDRTAQTLNALRRETGNEAEIRVLEQDLKDLDAELSDRAAQQQKINEQAVKRS